jgi:hypothetical protein
MENLNRYEMAINTLEKIKSIMENTIKKYGVNPADLCENGGIFYMNANDGTAFDWLMNGNTCEFFTFWKSCELGFCKLQACEDGNIIGYVFKEGEYKATENFKEYVGESECRALADLMYLVADCRNEYDENIKNINFDDFYTNSAGDDMRWVFELDDDEEEEEDY